MKTIVSIADNILRDLPGSVSTDREKAVVQTIQGFAIKSGFFKFTTEHTITEYDVDTSANDSVALNPTGLKKFRPLRIESIRIDGDKKTLIQRDILTDLSDFDLIYNSSRIYYTIDYKGRLIILPFPTDTAFETTSGALTVTVEAVYTIDDSTTEIDDFFYARWGKVIEAGATALMMSEPNKPWSNQNDSSRLANSFLSGINMALMKRNLEENNGEMRVEKIPFV